ASSGPYGAMEAFAFARYSRSTGLPSKFHLPNWTLIADPFSSETLSAAIEDCVHFRGVWLVVDHTPADFDPGVGLERHLLRANHQLRRDTIVLEEASRGRGPLQ